jgi:hypothetical protein
MRKLIYVILIVALVATPTIAYAKEDEPVKPWPKWATKRCVTTIYKIVQHEVGAMQDREVFRFMTEQIIQDVLRLGCNNLIAWRWKIGNYSLRNVTALVKEVVNDTVADYPNRKFPVCKFIGMPADREIWRKFGYDITIGYSKTKHKLTVIGVGCGSVTK